MITTVEGYFKGKQFIPMGHNEDDDVPQYQRVLKAKVRLAKENGDRIVIPSIVYYEIRRGLLAANASRKIVDFQKFCAVYKVESISKKVAEAAAVLYAGIKKKGVVIDDMDLLM
jgi:tRNA(fMet)-specific endonuclease VapC